MNSKNINPLYHKQNKRKNSSGILSNDLSFYYFFNELLKPNYIKNYEILDLEIWTNENSVICINSLTSEIDCISKKGYPLINTIANCMKSSVVKFKWEAYSSDEFDDYLFEFIGYNYQFVESTAIECRETSAKNKAFLF